MAESLLIGTLGALAGVAIGYGLLAWLVTTTLPSVAPGIAIITTLTGGTVLAAILLGAGAVALAPLFTLPRLRRMDVPSALRVVE